MIVCKIGERYLIILMRGSATTSTPIASPPDPLRLRLPASDPLAWSRQCSAEKSQTRRKPLHAASPATSPAVADLPRSIVRNPAHVERLNASNISQYGLSSIDSDHVEISARKRVPTPTVVPVAALQRRRHVALSSHPSLKSLSAADRSPTDPQSPSLAPRIRAPPSTSVTSDPMRLSRSDPSTSSAPIPSVQTRDQPANRSPADFTSRTPSVRYRRPPYSSPLPHRRLSPPKFIPPPVISHIPSAAYVSH